MRHATPQDLNAVYGHFQDHRKWFPHVRKDKLERQIKAGECVYQEGVVITYQRYRKATRVAVTGYTVAKAGDVILHQILNSNQFNGAAGRVLNQFINEVIKPFKCAMYLSVREDNKIAQAFYERHGMEVVSSATWAGSSILGRIYSLRA